MDNDDGPAITDQPDPGGATRPAAQAGRFYPAEPAALRALLARLLGAVERTAAPANPADPPPWLLIAPHAGYQYSGAVAATAYACVRDRAYAGVIVVAPSHQGAPGLIVPSATHFATPLGTIALTHAELDRLVQDGICRRDDAPHADEHAIEVQLPWLQTVLRPGWKLLPILLGRAGPEALARLARGLIPLLSAPNALWLLVVSTDTYHGYDGTEGLANDVQLAELLTRAEPEALWNALRAGAVQACGCAGLYVALLARQQLCNPAPQVLARSDSQAETHASGGYCVGYLAAEGGRARRGASA